MNCFQHRDIVAVGTCKFCGKAVCGDCVREEEFGIVCSEACGENARSLHEMNIRALKIYGIGEPKPWVSTPLLVWMIPGFVFGGFGGYTMYNSGEVDASDLFAIVMGVMLVGVGAVMHLRQRSLGQKN